MIAFLMKNLQGTDWELLAAFVSPVFFEVIPTIGMARALARMSKDFRDEAAFKATIMQAQDKLGIEVLDWRTKEKYPATTIIRSDAERKRRGEKVLEIYFAQLLRCESAVLDLRTAAFQIDNEWAPKAIFYRWQPDFRSAMGQIYRGFYMGDERCFTSGLDALNLGHAAAIFKKHFGEGGQDSVQFRLHEFKKSFHAIFQSCKKNRTKLHPDFFALGVYLLCLYEHLETLAVPFDVRACFLRAANQCM